MAFDVIAGDDRRPAVIPTLGRLAVHNALAAVAAGLAAGVPIDGIAAALARGWSAPHRAQLVRAGEVTIVDDSYNASPASVAAALELLAGLPGRRVAVLGEMLELGSDHEDGHRRTGEAAAALTDDLVVVGTGAAPIVVGARAAGMKDDRVTLVADRDEARDRLVGMLRPGDVVLVKASRGIALDVLVDQLVSSLGSGAGAAGVRPR